MPKEKRFADYIELAKDNDSWGYAPTKLPRMDPIKLDEIFGVRQFDGVRNPSSRSNTSHKLFIPYRTPANDWIPKVGIAESAAEGAVAIQLLMSPEIYDLEFQPCTIEYEDEDGIKRKYTHDLRVTFTSGERRVIFVRNHHSLLKPKTRRSIDSIFKATTPDISDTKVVVDADDFTRQRRENLFRMYYCMTIADPDPEADQIVWEAVHNISSLYFMKDIFKNLEIEQWRAFQACYRLIAKDLLWANLDNVLWENSHIRLVR